MRVEDERALALGFPADVPVKTYGLFAQIIFFILTCRALAAFHAIVFDSGLVTGIAALALAEYLIRRYRWERTGVESALWIGGLAAFISDLPNSGKPESWLVLTAAAAIAGARVRNPLFGAVAAACAMHYFEVKWDLGVLFALVVATLAIAMLCRTWQRPSTEWLFILIAVALPLAGWAEADAKWRTVTIALYAAFGVVALIAGLVKPHHAFFHAAVAGFTVAAIVLGRELALPLETMLAIGGAFLLALSLILSRVLRGRERGFISTPEPLTKAGDLIEIAGALSISPPQTAAARESGGGQFGGAGASGDY